MNVIFSKYHCLGRDFILLDNRNGAFEALQPAEISRLCARRFGIGASGILRLDDVSKKSTNVTAFNFNGALAEFNVVDAACVAVFVKNSGTLPASKIKINEQTVCCKLVSNHENMHFVTIQIPEPILIKKSFQNFVMDYGTPLCMVPTDDVSKIDVVEKGREISYHKKRFPKGANVTFYQPHHDFLEIRHYEYQADQETYTNGLCVIGAALSHAQNISDDRCLVRTKGGEMQVSFERSNDAFCNVELKVLVNEVYEGKVRK
ncbi:MAG: hypothetical protein LBP96_03130 [Bacteroidales bacterium]|jgi:diaminopimelate epimerase|nr:hypothetical protein [Bacteroidales bacterium]